jgi:hypothetical protein
MVEILAECTLSEVEKELKRGYIEAIRSREEIAIMRKPDKPDDSLISEEEAELRAFRRIANALERDNIDLAAALLLAEPDPAWPAPASRGRPKEK